MRTVSKILVEIVKELVSSIDNIQNTNFIWGNYYNYVIEDFSILLAELLENHLKSQKKEIEWEQGRWIDDSLITKIELKNDCFFIDGVVIWGVGYSTEQFVDFFSFYLELDENTKKYKKYHLKFIDLNYSEISYEKISHNSKIFNITPTNWEYIFSGGRYL